MEDAMKTTKRTGNLGQTQYVREATITLGNEERPVMFVIEKTGDGRWTLDRVEGNGFGGYEIDGDCLGFYATKREAVAEMAYEIALG